jgi:hypothetical protein
MLAIAKENLNLLINVPLGLALVYDLHCTLLSSSSVDTSLASGVGAIANGVLTDLIVI